MHDKSDFQFVQMKALRNKLDVPCEFILSDKYPKGCVPRVEGEKNVILNSANIHGDFRVIQQGLFMSEKHVLQQIADLNI